MIPPRYNSCLAFTLTVFISLAVTIHYGLASTIGLVGGDATVDGRPLLIKNRDNSANANQEFFFNRDGPLNYISVSYAGLTDQAFGGVNEVGFAIVNANAWNMESQVPGPDDDGIIMDHALRNCVTVEDFQAVMDSTNLTGRTRPFISAVMDAAGAGSFFEADDSTYFRFDVNDSTAAPNGYMVRANFAYEGGSYHLGPHRHDRFLALLDSAYAGGFISHDFISMYVQQDIVNEETNPYPLPFAGREEVMPYGLIHTHDALNRDITRSGCVIQGVTAGEDPQLAAIWAIVGEPTATIALPLWVYAESTPVEFDGPEYSALNLKAQDFRDYLYQRHWSDDAIDTWKMLDENGAGLLSFLNSLESQVDFSGDSALSVWRVQGLPSPIEVENFQNFLAANTLAQMETWGPPQTPEITFTWIDPEQVQIDWTPVSLDVFNRPITVSSYTVYGSNQPFLDRLRGDSLTTVSTPPAILTVPQDKRFFQVRCHP